MVSRASVCDAPRATPALRVDGLSKTFGSGEGGVVAVDDLSLSVDHGEVVGLLGPNGAGKTTAVKAMLGLVIPDAGTVEVCGVNVHEDPGRAYGHLDAMLEGARNVYWRLTVRENLAYFAGLGGVDPGALADRHDRLLDSLGLADDRGTVVNELSRGMKQKVSLATTLARNVDVVFLDEPTLGLDVESSLELRAELRRLAHREDVTIICCSHDMAVVEAISDRVVVLQDGRVIADDPVDELGDIFSEKRFSVTVRGPMDDPFERELRDRFDATIRRERASPSDEHAPAVVDTTGIDAEVAADLLEALRGAGLTLTDIETAEPTLEEAFLRLTGSDAGSGDRDEREGQVQPMAGVTTDGGQ